MRKKLSWSLALSLVAAIAAWAAAPPNLDLALDAQLALLEREPENAAAEVDLGNLLLLDGKTAEAEAAYRRAIELDPDSVSAHFNLGLLLQERGDGFAALRSYRRVLKLEPEHAWAHYQLGVLHDGWNLKGAAVDSYARALAANPRLRFADVNPHVIENRYLTEAMLRAYRKYLPAAQPPTTYEEPNRIAAILLQPGKARVAGGQVGAAAAAAADTAPATPGATVAADEPTRVLSAGDLGTAEVAGAVGRTPSAALLPPGVGMGIAPESDVERYEPPVFQVNTSEEESTDAPSAVGIPIYPGAESSGRLEMKLREPGDRRALG